MSHDPPGASPVETVLGLTTGVWTAQALWAAACLGIADQLAGGPRTPAALAEATGTLARPLHRVLRALASLGIFAEADDGTYANTPASELLRSDVPGSLRDYVRFVGQPWHLAAYGEILHSLRTGKPSIDRVVGKDIWAFFASDTEAGSLFNAAMTSIVADTAHAVRDAYDFSTVHTLVDIGGGHGYLLANVLAATPSLRGVLFDQPTVVEGAGETFERLGVAERVTRAGGDFFCEVPRGDAYILSHIIHDWDDERSTAILQAIHRAAEPGARVLLVETVIPPGNAFSFGKLLDLEMLCLPGGIERTEAEYRALLGVSGFRLERVLATRSAAQIIESVKV